MSDPITNEDEHTVNDLRPPFLIPNLDSYINDEAELLHILDLFSEDQVMLLEHSMEILERAATMIFRIYPDAGDFLNLIVDNARDLAFEI